MVNDPEQDPVALGQRGPVGPEKQGQLTRTEKNKNRDGTRHLILEGKKLSLGTRSLYQSGLLATA